MFITHKLRKGETFATVMKKYRVTDWKTTWDLKQNKALKAKRKYADKVIEGDELIVLDPSAKLLTIEFLGKTYNVPQEEWAMLKKSVADEMKKKFLPGMVKLKAAYDADYEFLWGIANGQGAMTGMLAAIVETTTRAKLPTAEMNATSTAIKKVQKAINAADFAGLVSAGLDLQTAMNAYVAAAEKYRSKMTQGASKGVEALEITRDGCFILAGALASGGASVAVGTAFSAVEIGAAMGAATALVKAGSGEIGNVLAGTKRTAEEITLTMVKDALFGAASGATGALLRGSEPGQKALAWLSAEVMKQAPSIVAKEVGKSWFKAWLAKGTLDRLGEKVVADIVAATIMRLGATWYLRKFNAWFGVKEYSDALIDAFGSAIGGMTGKESPTASGAAIGAQLASTGILEKVVRAAIEENEKTILAALEKAEAKAGATGAH